MNAEETPETTTQTPPEATAPAKRTARWKKVLGTAVVLLVLAQLVPVPRTNPPVEAKVAWDSPRTEALARRACFDCHSNETKWPWYSHVAPASWLVAYDVVEAREHFNMSLPNPRHADDAADEVSEGEMPPWQYRIAHPEARLTDSERAELAKGLEATFGGKETK